MSIERTGGGEFEIVCDACPETAWVDAGGEWSTLMEMLREEGWTKRNVRGEWLHFCPECVEEQA